MRIGMIDAFPTSFYFPIGVVALRLLAAALLGAALGIEREWRERPAGLRTHMLVSVASAVFAITALEIVHMPAFETETLRTDPLRLIAAITSGVAFLAAGFIIFHRGAVQGVTTGAGMWLAAAIGLAVGLGLWHVAVLATVFGVLALTLFRRFEMWLDLKHRDERGAPDTRDNTH